ncbi:MAG: hypothetical protein HKM24_07410 [Gammaproteobacteria bacterium]|nr:hypothetical protein [Gammaproteobacteria bacterium]
MAGLKQVRQWVPAIKSARGYSDHCLLDARSLALHCKIAQKISQDPTLINQAKANLERWAQRYPNAQPKYFSQWKNILNRSWEDVAAFITSLSEEATQLRQSSPFAGILTTKERKKIYDAF